MLLGVFALWPVWQRTLRVVMGDGGASYIAIVPLMAIWLFWTRRDRLNGLDPKHRWIGPVIAMSGWGLVILSSYISMDFIRATGAVLMLIAGPVSLWGWPGFKRFAPVWGLLFFLVPPSAMFISAVAAPLEAISSTLATDILGGVGVPIEKSGSLIRVNGVAVNVVEACSGVRGAFAMLLLLYLWVFLNRFSVSMRVLFMALAVPIAILSNTIRLTLTALAYGYGDAYMADLAHDLLGLLLLAVSLLLVCHGLTAAIRWAGWGKPANRPSENDSSAVGASSVRPSPSAGRVWWAAIMTAIICVAAGVSQTYAHADRTGPELYHESVRASFFRMPSSVQGWHAEDAPLTAPATRALKPNAVYSVRLTDPVTGQSFSASVIHCRFIEDMGAHAPPVCYPNNGWTPMGERQIPVQVTGQSIQASEYSFNRIQDQRVVQLRTVNFFVLPNGRTEHDHRVLYDLARNPWPDAWGVARVQLVFSSSFSREERRRLTQACLDAFEPVLSVIAQSTEEFTP